MTREDTIFADGYVWKWNSYVGRCERNRIMGNVAEGNDYLMKSEIRLYVCQSLCKEGSSVKLDLDMHVSVSATTPRDITMEQFISLVI